MRVLLMFAAALLAARAAQAQSRAIRCDCTVTHVGSCPALVP
jgi:hypothetical protein